MEKVTGQILKGSDIQVSGTRQINITAVPSAQPQPKGPATARLLQSGDGFALIELTCSCGIKTTIKCNYQPNNAQ